MPEKKTPKTPKAPKTKKAASTPTKASITKAKYDKQNSVFIGVKLHVVTDAPILARLSQVPSMAGYIRSVLFDDVRRNHPELMKIERFEKEQDSISLGRVSPPPEETYIVADSTSPSNPRKKRKPDPET